MMLGKFDANLPESVDLLRNGNSPHWIGALNNQRVRPVIKSIYLGEGDLVIGPTVSFPNNLVVRKDKDHSQLGALCPQADSQHVSADYGTNYR